MKKYFITGLLLLHFITLFGQECGTAGLDSASFYSQPWIGNNQYLFELKDSVETYMSDVAIETAYEGGINNQAIFWIPVKVWVYRTATISGPTGAEIEEAITNLNNQIDGSRNYTGQAHSYTRIKFYLKCDITYLEDPLGAHVPDDGVITYRINNNYGKGV